MKAAEAGAQGGEGGARWRSPEGRARRWATRASGAIGWGRGRRGRVPAGACEFKLGHPEAAEAAWSRVPAGSRFEPHAALYRARRVLNHDRFADAEPLLLTAPAARVPTPPKGAETLVNLYKIQGRFDERGRWCWAWGSCTATPPAC